MSVSQADKAVMAEKNHVVVETKDPESGNYTYTEEASEADFGSVDEIARARHIQRSFGPFRYLRQGEEWLDAKLGVELQGIDRVPEAAKNPPSLWNMFLLWFSLNIHIGVVPLGILGTTAFALSIPQSIAAGIIGIALGALCTAYTGTLSPRLGLRQIATSRYSFGFWGAKLCSVLNIIVGGGYAVVNYVAAGQILSAVSDGHLTISLGIVIVAVVSYVISLFGFRLIHTFEKYSWIMTAILFCVLIGQAAPNVDVSAPGAAEGIGYYGSFLSMIALNFSNSSGWCSIVGDYYVQYKATTPSWKIFAITWIGNLIPTTFSVVIGSCIGGAVGTYAPYGAAYGDEHNFGELLRAIYHPTGFSKFALVLLTFSVIGNNVAINYSSGLSLQLLGHWFHAVPRLIWSFLTAVVITVLAIAGKDHLSEIIVNFVSLLGYWTVSFTMILLLEDRVFRRNSGYNLTVWDQPSKLPIGAAAVLALLSGYLAGGVPGMAQLWYIGPIAAHFGEYGGDVGIYMSAAITLVVYPVARIVERHFAGR